jgi:hypothetical protein
VNPVEWGAGEWLAALSLFVVVVGLIAHAVMPSEAPSSLVSGSAHPEGTSTPECDVMGCQEAPTKSRHGWKLCAGHYEEKVTGR